MRFVPGRMKSRVGLSYVSKLPNEIKCRKHGANEARTRLVWLASAVLRQLCTNTPHRPLDSLCILQVHTDHTVSLKYRLSQTQRDRETDGIRLSYIVRATHRSQKHVGTVDCI